MQEESRVPRSDHFQLKLSFRSTTRRRAEAAAAFLAAGVVSTVSYGWGWGHITFPKTPGETVVASVGYRNEALIFTVLICLAAILVGTSESTGSWLRKLSRSTAIPSVALAGYAAYDLAQERSHAIAALAANTAKGHTLPLDSVRALINGQVALGMVRFSFAPGIYVAFVAAALGALGAYLGWDAMSSEPGGPQPDAHTAWGFQPAQSWSPSVPVPPPAR